MHEEIFIDKELLEVEADGPSIKREFINAIEVLEDRDISDANERRDSYKRGNKMMTEAKRM